MKQFTYIIAISTLIVLSSCGKDSIKGGGSTTNEQRSLNSFTSVEGNDDIKIHIAHGTTTTTEVRGYRNLVDITETSVVNGKLIVKYKDEYYNVKNSNIELYIVIPELKSISTNGSGDVWIDGFQNTSSLQTGINGSSNINISNCTYNDVSFDGNGSGDINASGLSTQNVDAAIHGSGDIEITCLHSLKARIYGSGNIWYWGDPGLDVQVSGSGSIIKQ